MKPSLDSLLKLCGLLILVGMIYQQLLAVRSDLAETKQKIESQSAQIVLVKESVAEVKVSVATTQRDVEWIKRDRKNTSAENSISGMVYTAPIRTDENANY